MVADVTIYAITDASGNPRYVGRTRDDLINRLFGHASADTEIGEWVRANERDVRIVPLEVVVWEEEKWPGRRERYWIERYRAEGHRLANVWPTPRRFEAAIRALDAIEAERAA